MNSIMIDRTDGLASAAAIKGPVRVATTANIAITGLQTIDGVALVAGDRVLVKNQASGSENGIWVVDTGPWRRSKDFNKTKDVLKGTLVLVTQGTENGDKSFVVATPNPIVIGTTAITFDRAFATNSALQIADVVQGSGIGIKADPASSRRIIVSASRFDPLTYSGANIREKINNAITAAKAAGGGTVVLPDGQVDLDGGIVQKSFVELLGKSATVLKMKNGVSGHVLAGENADALFASPTFNPADGANQCTLRNLKIDGNRANVTGGGAGIKIWGWQLHFENVQVANAKGNAIMTSWTDAGVPMEPTFSRVKIDTCGANGWVFTGPHDAHFDDVTIVDAGQDAHNTYAGFYNASGGNGRLFNLHIWHRATATNRCAVACDSFGTNEYVASHFEGCVQQFRHSGTNDRLVGCFFYAPFGADDNALVSFANNDNQHVGCLYLGGTAPQNPNTYAVAFANNAAGNMISAGRFLGFTTRAAFRFISSGGNFIQGCAGYAGTGAVSPIAGTPHAQEVIDYTQGGTTPYRIYRPAVLSAFANDAAAGAAGLMANEWYMNSSTRVITVKS